MLIWFTFPINVFKKKLFWFESLRLRTLLLNSRCCVDVWNITKQSQPFLCFTTPIFHFGFEDSWDFGKTLNNPKFFFFFVLLLWVSKFQHYCSSTIQVIMSLLETKYRGRLIVCLFIVYFSQEPKEILDLFLYFVGTKKLPEINECMST